MNRKVTVDYKGQRFTVKAAEGYRPLQHHILEWLLVCIFPTHCLIWFEFREKRRNKAKNKYIIGTMASLLLSIQSLLLTADKAKS